MRAPRGYSLNLVLLLSALLVVLLGTTLAVMGGSAKLSGEMLARRQVFFATDGAMRGVLKLSNDFLLANPTAVSADLQTYFTPTILDTITPAGYTRESFTVSTSGKSTGPVPNGAFSGMNANLYPVAATIRLRKDLSLASSEESHAATLAQISMFQFMVFIDGFGDWMPGQDQQVTGRVHANGDICFAAGKDFCLSRVTASGGIYRGNNAACRFINAGTNPPYIAHDATPDFTTCVDPAVPAAAEWKSLDTAREHGCTNCGGVAGATWASWARTEFAPGNALDSDMGVVRLQLPVTGLRQAQAGKNAAGGTASNGTDSRFLVDPVRGADPPDAALQKFSLKADIRILDGVWYVKDPAAGATDWPGIPVWSDHPGNYTITPALSPDEANVVPAARRGVGQSDIRTAMAARGFPWNAAPPRLFSYYEVDSVNFQLVDNIANGAAGTADGVISYGGLARQAAATTHCPGATAAFSCWEPGHWPGDNAETDLCPQGKTGFAVTGFRSALDGTGAFCTGGVASGFKVDMALLNATRTGFHDGHVRQMVTGAGALQMGAASHPKILPMNFDVATFRRALGNAGAGELGSYFCVSGGACLERRPFNGIIWMGTTWGAGGGALGSLAGFGVGAGGTVPPLWPAQGNLTNASAAQPRERNDSNVGGGATDNAAAQRGLPYPLCSTSRANQPAVPAADAVVPFRFPNCTDFTSGLGARPMSVRLFNGGTAAMDYDFDGIDDGITFASNMPIYVLGPWNNKSSAGVNLDTSTGASLPWSPSLVAADQVYLLSTTWTDANEPWDYDTDAGRAVPTTTTYNIQILAGWAESSGGVYSGGIENFPRFIENWVGVNHFIKGSMVVGFDSPMYHWPRFGTGTGAGTAYNAPNRKWAYDSHLDSLANQPPGAPEYTVYATRAFTRK